MSHENFSITIDLCTHLSGEQSNEAARGLETLIAGSARPFAPRSRKAASARASTDGDILFSE